MNLLDIFSFNNKKKEVNKRSSVNVNYIASKANKYTSITNPDKDIGNLMKRIHCIVFSHERVIKDKQFMNYLKVQLCRWWYMVMLISISIEI